MFIDWECPGPTDPVSTFSMAVVPLEKAYGTHGKNPQLLIEKIVRERIYECLYWKEHCFGLHAETILDKIVELDYIGGICGGRQPCPFLCLLLKLLQLQPSKAIIQEYIQDENFKYLRILGLLYVRMVAPSAEVYRILEPYLSDRRKLRIRLPSGSFFLSYVDEVVDELLTKDRVFDLILPRLTKRSLLEDTGELEERPLFFTLNPVILDEQPSSSIIPALKISEPENNLWQDKGSLHGNDERD